MFLRNSWYMAAWAKDLERTLLPRTILREPLVFLGDEPPPLHRIMDRVAQDARTRRAVEAAAHPLARP
jgi:hypothetical protein